MEWDLFFPLAAPEEAWKLRTCPTRTLPALSVRKKPRETGLRLKTGKFYLFYGKEVNPPTGK
jgi:hypothetical protein